MLEFLLNEVAGCRPATLFKRESDTGSLPQMSVNIPGETSEIYLTKIYFMYPYIQ